MSLLPSARLALALTTALLAAVLVGCGEDDSDRVRDAAGAGDGVPVTPRALAWLAAEHWGTPDAASGEDDLEELGSEAVGAQVRYGQTGEYDGDALTVGVAPSSSVPESLLDCDSEDNEVLDGCEEIADGVLLQWQEEEPEEDPGVVYVFVTKGDTTVVLFQSSEPVTGDPREVDLTVSVDDMVELGQDERVGLTTTQEAVDAGEDLPYWTGSED